MTPAPGAPRPTSKAAIALALCAAACGGRPAGDPGGAREPGQSHAVDDGSGGEPSGSRSPERPGEAPWGRVGAPDGDPPKKSDGSDGAPSRREARAASPAGAAPDEPRADPALVAVLLPLSGRHASVGREMRTAIEIAAANGGGGVKLRFLDTRGDADEAARLVDRAADDRAIGVLGPVGQLEAGAAAARARERGVPIAMLAPEATPDPAAGVFRLWSSAAWEAEEAARLAVGRGHDRLAVLHPRDAQGAAQAEAFARAARAAGVSVVAEGDYDPTARDLEPDVKRFLGLDPATNPRLRKHLRRFGRKDGWKRFSPDVPFDLLYVPDEVGRAALVASYLPYFNIEVRDSDVMDLISLRRKHGGHVPSVVQLLGSSGWFHRGLAARGGDAVDGALVVVPCAIADGGVADQPSDQAAELAERFEARTGRPPGPVAGQAHDAARLFLAARARAAAAAAPRDQLRRTLATARLPDGACGPSAMSRTGALERAASLLQVDGDGFTPADQ